jgi:hypothetical protein
VSGVLACVVAQILVRDTVFFGVEYDRLEQNGKFVGWVVVEPFIVGWTI